MVENAPNTDETLEEVADDFLEQPSTTPAAVDLDEDELHVDADPAPGATPTPETLPPIDQGTGQVEPNAVTHEDLAPIQVAPTADRMRFAAEQEAHAPGLKAGVRAAADVESTSLDLLQMFFGNEEFIPNPSFQYSKELWKEITVGIPESYQDIFEEAVSEGHARKLRSKMLSLLHSESVLTELGFGGVGLRILAAILDPSAIAVSVATEGAAAPFIYGGKLSRIAMAVRAGLVTSATTTGLEAFLLTQNPAKDPRDLLFAATGGLILGSGLSALTRGSLRAKLQGQLKDFNNDILAEDIAALGGQLSGKGIRRLSPRVRASSPEVRAGAPRTSPPSLEEVQAEIVDLAQGGIGSEVVAGVHLSQVQDLKGGIDEFLANVVDAPETAGVATVEFLGKNRHSRFDWAARLKKSRHPAIRDFGNNGLEDAVGAKADPGKGVLKGEKPLFTADLAATQYYKVNTLDYFSTLQPAFKEWSEAKGFNWLHRQHPKYLSQFGREMSDAIEDVNRTTSGRHSAPVLKAAEKQIKITTKIADDLAAEGIPGFANLTAADKAVYFTRKWKYDAVAEANVRFGSNNVVAAFKAAILRGSENMPDELAGKIAKGLNEKLQNVHLGREAGINRIFGQDDIDTLRDILIEEGIMDAKEIDTLIGRLGTTKPDGRPSIGKFRIRLDTSFEVQSPGGMIRIKDMLNRDAVDVFDTYTRSTAGMIAVSKHLKIKTDADFARLVDNIKASAPDTGITAKELKAEIEVMDISYNLILGRPSPLLTDPGTESHRLFSLLLIYNFNRVMGRVGFAQMAEIGTTIGQTGMRPMLQHIPSIGKIFKRSRNMELDADPNTIDELAMMGGIGHDTYLNQASIRLDPSDGLVAADDVIGKATVAAQVGRRAMVVLSGLGPITDWTSRLAAQLTAQNLTDLAFNATKTLSKTRIRKMGLNDEMAERVYEQIRLYSKVDETTTFGSRVLRRINLAGWADTEARAAFVVSVNRQVRSLIQQNDIGNLSTFMSKRMGQALLQFRTFSIVSYPKQMINGFHNNDMRAYMGFMQSMFVAANAYVAMTYVASFGRDNRRQWLKDRLSPTEIAKAAFQRAGFTHLLPGIIDTGMYLSGNDPLFTYRTTNLATNFLTGSPSVSMGISGFNAVAGVLGAAFHKDRRFSKQNFRNVKTLLPFHTLMGISNLADFASQDLPKRSSR